MAALTTQAPPHSVWSPRRNLNKLFEETSGEGTLPENEQEDIFTLLTAADSENKLSHRKLYLVLDLDETIAYTKRIPPGELACGHRILVRGDAYDMVLRPGLQLFLKRAAEDFIIYLYTMGDEDYTQAALAVIDPDRIYFTGGICCWRPTESRNHKNLDRVLCDKRMALIVDDTVDVWHSDLANLCLIRRFIGDPKDDSLMRLAWQMQLVHRNYFSRYNVNLATPPDVRDVLRDIRGQLLAGCQIALTGVAQVDEETLESHPLCSLVRLYGADLTLSVDSATHLVARKKDGWQTSSKVRKALQRRQVEADFYAVWDHWMLDTMCSWDRQPESSYSIPPPSPEMNDPRMASFKPSAPSTTHVSEHGNFVNGDLLSELDRDVMNVNMPTVMARKRARESQQEGPGVTSKIPITGSTSRQKLASEKPSFASEIMDSDNSYPNPFMGVAGGALLAGRDSTNGCSASHSA